MDIHKLAREINNAYLASVQRGATTAYLEGAQIGRLKLSFEHCQYAEGTPECTDWRRGYFTETGRQR